ncbi:MAG: CRISPR-associated endonuclease Cas1 [Chloroflexota bacterium]|nr:CRISPR-associated endonuclease Cas1 [Chloroflexota bacterium]
MPAQRRTSARRPAAVVPAPSRQDRAPVVIRDGVLVLSGYGLRIAVERGHLVVEDGIGPQRRSGKLAKATCRLRRLIVLGHAGTVSLEALRWLHDISAAFVQLGADAEVVACFAPLGLDDPRLRRAQALAPTTGTGVSLTREVLAAKLRGQAALLPRLPGGDIAGPIVAQALVDLEQAETTEQLRQAEAAGAKAYWSAWAGSPIPFARKDAGKVPTHWLAYNARSSPLTGSPRSAADPANALLNYLYALLETEARIACLAVGLDPGLGVLHAALKARDSLALDVMEAARPGVDAYILDLLGTRVFSRNDVFETRAGTCRLLPPLTECLAQTTRSWARAVGPWVERAAKLLLANQVPSKGSTLPTPLTGANRRAGRGLPSKEAGLVAPKPPTVCRECGVVLEDLERLYCDGCLRERRAEAVAIFAGAGPEQLARLRVVGQDPAHGGDAGRKRGRRNAEHVRAIAEWERLNGRFKDAGDFTLDILPGLQGLPLSALMDATGLSLQYCSLIRRGLKVPHPRHWARLGRIADDVLNERSIERRGHPTKSVGDQ